ncbi:MAG TPA: ATP-dependent helicase HrpB, partial [Candidatus Tenderia electrophaga]|nr:ATP-dependent helicase HrpB [Candidatus Tenderia electrophaga]
MTLPINAILDELSQALTTCPNVVLQAPPGAGKTTRVPLALLDNHWLAGQKIIMLEPRRLAARTAAAFMAASLGERVGQTVGYRIRLDSKVGPNTVIEVVTEGILTRMLQGDPELSGIGLVIFDEFHERSLQADLGLALCLESQVALRDDLKILVMSATLDGAATATLLGDAPLISSQGRSYPVDIHHLAPPPRARREQRLQHQAGVIAKAMQNESGSALVFLPGTGEIRQLQQQLQHMQLGSDILITPLYGDLSLDAQQKAIQAAPAGKRKIVLATNIAETSLTIEGVRIVIDSGLARVPRFEPGTGLTRLETVNISQASAEQRRGRAGRLEPGVCYRLWPAGQHLLAHSNAEILDADLGPLALELAQWGCHDPAQLQWLNPPPKATFNQAQDLLQQLGALNKDLRITAHGQQMARLPLHPRLAHMILKGKQLGAGKLACQIAALLSERDPLRKTDHPDSDINSRLRLLQTNSQQANLKRIRQSARQWQQQLNINANNNDLSMTGMLLGHAYPDRIAQRRPGKDNRYLLANGRGAIFNEHESLANEPYLVIAELGARQTEARIFLAAAIDAQQIEEYFPELIKTANKIHWDQRNNQVQAVQQQTLGTLVLEEKQLDEADPEDISTALLEGIRQTGLSCLPWSKSHRQWQQRLQFLHQHLPDNWPDLSDQALLNNLDEWLAPFLSGMSRLSHLNKLDLQAALNTLLPWPQQQQLDELA